MTDRERLIELKINFVENFDCGDCKPSNNKCRKCLSEKEADYLLEHGVIVPPCKFGSGCYVIPTIHNKLPDITGMKCIGYALSYDAYNINLITEKNKLYQPCFGEFGKTVFLTREEAEKALKKEREIK